jgi:hypothetical protein
MCRSSVAARWKQETSAHGNGRWSGRAERACDVEVLLRSCSKDKAAEHCWASQQWHAREDKAAEHCWASQQWHARDYPPTYSIDERIDSCARRGDDSVFVCNGGIFRRLSAGRQRHAGF